VHLSRLQTYSSTNWSSATTSLHTHVFSNDASGSDNSAAHYELDQDFFEETAQQYYYCPGADVESPEKPEREEGDFLDFGTDFLDFGIDLHLGCKSDSSDRDLDEEYTDQ